MDMREIVNRNLLVRCMSGSRAYGTSMPGSDIDIRGVFCADPISVITPFFGVEEVAAEGDTKYFELSKYVKLVCDQNPNIVELLWVDPSDILFESPAWSILKNSRSKLLTTKVRATYGGYASQALRDMRSRDRWINNPQPEQAPKPREFVNMIHNVTMAREFNHQLPTEGKWTAVGAGQDIYLLFEGGSGSWFDNEGNLRTFTREEARDIINDKRVPSAIMRFDSKRYEDRKRDHKNYWTWIKERNPTRSELERKVNYDAKNASHLIRLLRTAHEILTDGVVRVRRPDAAELLEIRRGEWSYERVLAAAEEIDATLAEAEAKSSLPRTLDQTMVANLVLDAYHATWNRKPTISVQAPLEDRPISAPDPRERTIFLDLEMSGYMDDGKFCIVEIGAVEAIGGRLTGRSFHSYVNPDTNVNIHARRIHGLSKKFLSTKPSFDVVAPLLLEFIGDAPVFAHNAESDVKALLHDLRLADLPETVADRFHCSERLATRIFGTQLSLDNLCDCMGIDRSGRERGHSASMDAALLAQCVIEMSHMPEYQNAIGTVVAKRFVKKPRNHKVSVEMDESDGTATFSLSDGSETKIVLPDFPRHSHTITLFKGALMVTTGEPKILDNPNGPALIKYIGGSLQKMHFNGGKFEKQEAYEPQVESHKP